MNDECRAPVVMISYNRPDLVRMTMRNVAQAETVENRAITMYIDGPRNESDRIKQDEIERIVSGYQKELSQLRIVRREKNLGCRKNIVSAITEALDYYGRAIIVEDDILISRSFLRYMDAALEFYKNDKHIWCINAYQNPYFKVPKNYAYDIYLNPVNMCWGWGTWRDRWEEVDFDMKDWTKDRQDEDLIMRLNKAGRYIIPLLEAQYAGRLKTWDIQCTYHVVKHGYRCVEPIYQLSKNIGFGPGGEHCDARMPFFSRQKYYNFMPRLVKNIGENEDIERQWEYLSCNKNFFDRVIRKLKREMAIFSPSNLEPVNIGGAGVYKC